MYDELFLEGILTNLSSPLSSKFSLYHRNHSVTRGVMNELFVGELGDQCVPSPGWQFKSTPGEHMFHKLEL